MRERASGERRDVQRVVLTGAESTGKTRLAAQLAEHYGTVWLGEYVREFVAEKDSLPEPEDLPLLASRHMERDDALVPAANRLLILDTDLISTCVYSRYYMGGCPESVERASAERHAALYLLLDIDVPWEPDPGQRDSPEARAALHHEFETELRRRQVRYVLISGRFDERLGKAIAAVDALLDREP